MWWRPHKDLSQRRRVYHGVTSSLKGPGLVYPALRHRSQKLVAVGRLASLTLQLLQTGQGSNPKATWRGPVTRPTSRRTQDSRSTGLSLGASHRSPPPRGQAGRQAPGPHRSKGERPSMELSLNTNEGVFSPHPPPFFFLYVGR